MTSDVPWRFRGLRPEVREAALQAARRAGVPVGEWLNEIIIDSAAEEGVYPEPPVPALTTSQQAHDQQAHDDLAAVKNRLEEITRQLDRLSQPAPAAGAEPKLAASAVIPPAIPATAPPAAANGTTSRAPVQPADKPDDYAMRLDQAVAEIRSRRYMLDSVPLQAPEPNVSTAPAAPAFTSAGLEQQLRHITRQIEGLRQPCGAADAVAMLRGELTDMADLLKSALPQRAIELLEAEVRNLSKRIDEQRGNGGAAAAIGNLERGLAELRETLKTLKPAESLVALDATVKELSRKIETVGAQSADAPSLTQLDTIIAGLRGTIGNVASSDVVSRLANEMRALSAKVDEVASAAGGGADLLSSLEKRIGAMADTLEKHNSHCGKGSPHLEDVLTLLVERLEQGAVPGSDPKALHLLEDRLARVTSRLDDLQPANVDLAALRKIEDRITAITTQLDPGALHQIENRIATLTGRLDQPPPAASDAAALHQLESRIETLFEKLDDISRSSSDPAALRDLEHRIVAIASKLDASDARFAHLEAIEQGLAGVLAHVEDLRAGQAESLMRATMPAADRHGVDNIKRELDELKNTERRTQSSIEAVHGTLGHVVDRLALIENDLRGRTALTPVAARPAQPSAPGPARVEAAPMPQPLDRGLAPDTPLEPGSATARGLFPATSLERGADVATGPSPAGSAATADPSARLNFIAAARRAAQAAAAEPPRATPRTQTGADQDGGLGTRPKGKASPTRSIIVGISVLVILLGATHVLWDYLATPDARTAASVPDAEPSGHAVRTPATPASAVPMAVPVPMPAPEPQAPAKVAPDAKPVSSEGHTEMPGLSNRQQTASIDHPASSAPLQSPVIPEAMPVAEALPGTAAQAATGTVGPDSREGFAIPPAEPLQAVHVAAPVADTPAAATPVTAPDHGEDISALPAAIGGVKLRAAAIKGDAAAQFEIANRFAEGRGVAQHLPEAARWFELAANQGLTPAQFQIASLYEKGRGVKKNLAAARRYYAAAAQGGNAKAMHNLAVLYAEGLAGKSDYATAAMWFRMAANRGVTDSQYNLGILYARGIGVDRNLVESYKWFALAAKQGDKDAESKRDDVSARLDQPAQAAAERAVKTFVPEPQPESAIKISAPAGGWDQPEGGAAAAKDQGAKSGAERSKRNKRSSKS